MKKINIGVIGSMADKSFDSHLKTLSAQIGREIAKQKATLLFCFEGDFDSVSAIAAKSASQFDGEVIAFVWGNQKQKIDVTQIITGQQRGGGREFSFILSCDAIICLGGGSGTLMELAMAYQANIPIVTVKNSGGWSQKLTNKFIDERKRSKILCFKNAKDAVNMAIKLAKNDKIKT